MLKRLATITAAMTLVLGCSGALAQDAIQGTGAVLRSLDKVNGQVMDAEIPLGGSAKMQGLLVTVSDCRYPADNPTGGSYAYLQVRNPQDGVDYFQGWMVAASPALNALDHNRYDVWVLRCKTS